MFLSLMQSDETVIGYFDRMKLKLTKKKDAEDEGHGGNREGLRRDSSQLLRFCRHFSPWLFETSGRCHSIMPSLFILFIQW